MCSLNAAGEMRGTRVLASSKRIPVQNTMKISITRSAWNCFKMIKIKIESGDIVRVIAGDHKGEEVKYYVCTREKQSDC
jgi:hypothetical protein